MNLRITPSESAAVRDGLARLADGIPDLPAGADLAPALPATGGVPGRWTNASGQAPAEAGVVLYVHGGGFAGTEPRAERALAHRLSQATGRPVFGVDYRLAPAHPYPAALHDVAAVHRSLIEQGVPAGRIVHFGESAGATLVLSALLILKAAGDTLPATAVVVSPLADLTLSSPSLTVDQGRDTISKAALETVCTQYLAGARPDAAPQSPLHGELSGLPDLLVIAGGAEVLADDARRLAAAATAAGTPARLDLYEDLPHVFHLAMLADAPTTATDTFLHRLAQWTHERTA
ncbi:alpha/beta hydrolase fold domain-containing protein [Streptomyces sp. TLI_185]|uniref:alpha/beta hydrolase fold domain-containing protein n=1 Tax=Streptomyces sp. TLI_185 TaxID=2485151 RepID=UPI000FA4F164|nr:alpha/beta hydrolase [Streptomyces sp. TLI_185]RPF24738.1 acetyl esterase/lipase [Streptomyces sp. TLI_185]